MSYLFNGTSEYLIITPFSAVNAWPKSLFIQFNSSDDTINQICITYEQVSNPWNGLQAFYLGATAGDPVNFGRFGSTGVTDVNTYLKNVWNTIGGFCTNDTTFDVMGNGTLTAGSGSTAYASPNADALQIGARAIPGFNSGFKGMLAMAAIWEASLNADEWNSLAKGFSPWRVRPQSLREYFPLIREKIGIRAGNVLTTSGSPSAQPGPRAYGM